ncbi:MAG: hypothetical protein U5R14_14950 [Gemmatimonadota bacterium]|nr:hypothetical protein [Gemmatimonadota bacterium]
MELIGMLEGSGEQVEATFTASVDELALADLLAFAESTVGALPLGDQLPDDASALRDVTVEVGSGDPPTLTVLGTVTPSRERAPISSTRSCPRRSRRRARPKASWHPGSRTRPWAS